MSKPKKITTIIIACIFAILGTIIIFWYFGDTYTDFYSAATKEFSIPGLNAGFTPQGICHDEDTNTFLLCGYMKNSSASRIYVVDAEDKTTIKHFTLKDGENDYVGHAGGIATDGTNVWIVGEGKVFRFALGEISSVENAGKITILDSFESNNGADFVTVESNNLWIGEFHRDKGYATDISHAIQTSDGKTNKALSFCYEINTAEPYGITSTVPTKALSTTSLVQGMVVTSDKIILSTSYSLPNSRIYTYSNIMTDVAEKTFSYSGTEIPLYVLESKDLTDTLQAPSMSEEMVLVSDRVYILFENACQKYGFITRETLRFVYSFAI